MRVESGANANGVAYRGSDVDLRMIGRSLWRKKWRVIVPTLAVGALAVVAVNVVTPRYESEARLLVEGRENIFLRPANDRLSTDEARAAVDAEAITSHAQVLQSRDVALQVIKELNLGERAEFDPVKGGPSLVSTLLSIFGLARDHLRQSPEERVLTNYYDRLAVLPIDKSRVIQIKFQSSDPQLSARIVNAIIDRYFVFQRESKVEQNRNASQWLEQEIEKLRPKVTEAERNAETFRAKANLFAGSNNATLTGQQLSDLNTQIAAARAQKADLDARSRMIRNMLRSGRPIEASDISGSELIRRLVEQRVTLRSQFAEQSSTLLDQHPRIKELRAQIVSLDGQIRAETVKLVETLENDAKIAGARIETTMAAADSLKNQIAGLGSQEVELRSLEPEAKAQRDLLESYLGKYREATTRDTLDSAPSDVRVISRAIASNTPAFPKRIPIVAIAMLATMFIAMSLVVTAELLDPDLSGASSATRAKKARVARSWRRKAAIVPESLSAQASNAPKLSTGALAMALRRAGEAGRRVAVIGEARGSGATFAAIALARALSQQGARTILADFAFAAPNLAVISSDPAAPGIAELVRGAASFGNIVSRDRFSSVHLIAAGRVDMDPAAILSSPRLSMAMDALLHNYDNVLIDGGCVDDAAISLLPGFAPRAILVADDAGKAEAVRARMLEKGFVEVTILPGRGDNAQRPAAA